MEYYIRKMNPIDASIISKWSYPEPYTIYSMDASDIDEFLNGRYYTVHDEENNLLGYYCFGQSAQVPVGNKFGVYTDTDMIDIGLGINPSLCGQGLGFEFLSQGIEFSRIELSAIGFRLTVASFNQRAIKVYERLGFKKVNSFKRISEQSKTEFIVMVMR